MASTFGGAFDRLEHDLRRSIIASLNLRRKNYCAGLTGVRWSQCRAILVGDRPGNGAKLLPTNHHHTPFYSTKNSSLWLNRQLVEAGIHENDLFWVNSADMHGTPSSHTHLEGWGNPVIFALGGNAATWLDAGGYGYTRVHHPQAWKRFHSKEAYPLIGMLRQTLDLQEVVAG